MARMLPGEAGLVPGWTGLSGRAKSVKRFERSNGLKKLRYIKTYLFHVWLKSRMIESWGRMLLISRCLMTEVMLEWARDELCCCSINRCQIIEVAHEWVGEEGSLFNTSRPRIWCLMTEVMHDWIREEGCFRSVCLMTKVTLQWVREEWCYWSVDG